MNATPEVIRGNAMMVSLYIQSVLQELPSGRAREIYMLMMDLSHVGVEELDRCNGRALTAGRSDRTSAADSTTASKPSLDSQSVIDYLNPPPTLRWNHLKETYESNGTATKPCEAATG